MVLAHKAMVVVGKGKTWDTEASEMKQNGQTWWSMVASAAQTSCSPERISADGSELVTSSVTSQL